MNAYGSAVFDQHQDLLRASMISVEVARQRKYVSVDTKKRLEQAQLKQVQQRPPGLLIPLYGPGGPEMIGHQYRPDSPRIVNGRAVKYETPAAMRMVLDVHPSMRTQVGDPTIPLIVTEGIRKGDAAVSVLGLPAVSLLGVWNWRGTNDKAGKVALAQWEHIALNSREVLLAFDSDAMTKKSVHGALERLGAFLTSRHANVSYVYLPQADDDKTGLDDWLAQSPRTVEDLRSLGQPHLLALPQLNEDGAYRLTDVGNAERLTTQFGEHMRWVPAWKKWVVWTGKRWEVDDLGQVPRNAKAVARALYMEAAGIENPELRKLFVTHARNSERASAIAAMMTLAQSEDGVSVNPDAFDVDPLLLNVENGTLDLRTGELRPHDPDDLCLKMAGTHWDPEATAPTFAGFIKQIIPDEDVIDFLCRYAGYSLTGLVSAQGMAVMHGTGSNGKSTLVGALLAMLGTYGQTAPADLLVTQRAGGATPELARMRGARMVSMSETEDGARFNEQLVKQLTGGETIACRALFRDIEEINPTWTPWLSTNHLPEIGGTDHAIWRRLHTIEFGVTIPDHEKDLQLSDKLAAELPGMLRWAVAGCIEFLTVGLQPPAAVKAATNAYRTDQDVIARWLDECCTCTPAARATNKVLWTSFETWCTQTGEAPMTQKKWGKRLTERSIRSEKIGHDNVTMRFGASVNQPEGSRFVHAS